MLNEHESHASDLWDEKKLASFLKRSVRTVQADRATGKGPPFLKLGKSVRYAPADVYQWISTIRKLNTAK